ncbi:SDR family oxidoreductase [Candidatus Dojkabacteria bacterium]|nr:SDR family oxidoreductase [Candidatus Dojkabacteria bacterium]
MDFKDKVVLVTGGGRGIGAETVKLFAKYNATVIINYNKDKESAQNLLDEINGNGMIIQADVSQEDDVIQMFDEISKKYTQIDVLVNNAGIVAVKPFKDLSLSEWKKVFDVNVNGVFLCSQQALKIMKKGGSIVNISSIRGLYNYGRPPISDYSASKAAVISFTKTLAKEVAPEIRVNTVAPGMTMTDIAKQIPTEDLKKFENDIYLKRLIEPSEVANAVVFLSSQNASGITGALLMVDGGQSLSK